MFIVLSSDVAWPGFEASDAWPHTHVGNPIATIVLEDESLLSSNSKQQNVLANHVEELKIKVYPRYKPSNLWYLCTLAGSRAQSRPSKSPRKRMGAVSADFCALAIPLLDILPMLQIDANTSIIKCWEVTWCQFWETDTVRTHDPEGRRITKGWEGKWSFDRPRPVLESWCE